MPEPIKSYSKDEITGAIVAVVIIGSLVAATVVLMSRGWHGDAKPLVDSVRPEAVQLAKNIMSWAFAVAGLVISTRKISDIPYTARVFCMVFIVAVLICGTKDWLAYSEDYNFWELMDIPQTIRFIAPTVAAYLFGTCARIWLRKGLKVGKLEN